MNPFSMPCLTRIVVDRPLLVLTTISEADEATSEKLIFLPFWIFNMSRRRTRRRPRNRTVTAPVSRGQILRNPPRVGPRTFKIRHREYIMDVTSAVSVFKAQQLLVNPGLATSFPWLSGLARNFERYKWLKLSFSLSPLLPTSTAGFLGLSPDYDAADDNSAAGKQKFMSFSDTVRGPIWTDITLHCDRRNLKSDQLFVRTGSLASNLDIKLYDALSLYILSAGIPGAAQFAELWVDYEIEFYVPQASAEEVWDASTVSSNPSNASILGTLDTAEQTGEIKIENDSATTGTYPQSGAATALKTLDVTCASLGGVGTVGLDGGPPGTLTTLMNEVITGNEVLQAYQDYVPALNGTVIADLAQKVAGAWNIVGGTQAKLNLGPFDQYASLLLKEEAVRYREKYGENPTFLTERVIRGRANAQRIPLGAYVFLPPHAPRDRKSVV